MVVTVTIWLLFVVATVRPPFWRGPLGFAIFVLTMTVNEIPLLLLGVFAVSMALIGRPDGVPCGVASAAFACATLTGLIWLQLRAGTARTAFEVGSTRGWVGSGGPLSVAADEPGSSRPRRGGGAFCCPFSAAPGESWGCGT